ncbi:MAG: hypothetical protein V1787_03685 [Candidatus Micrarchaeota archaeon]
MPRAQTATEYIFLVAGAIMFVTFVVLVLRANLIGETAVKLEKDVGTYFGWYAKNYIFFDNFDAGAAKWTPSPADSWQEDNGQYHALAAGVSYVGLTVSNFSYSVWLRTQGGSSGIVFRMQNETTYYSLEASSSPHTADLVSHGPGGSVTLATFALSSDPNDGMTLRLDAMAGEVSVYDNGAFIATQNLPAGYYDRGLLGLVSDNLASFDNVQICKEAC